MHRILSLPHAPLLPSSCNYARHSLPLFCHPSLAGFSARPFTLPLHFVCLFPQPPHNRKQPHQIPIHPVTPSRSTPSLAYASLVFSPPDPLKYRPASPPATPPQAIPSTAIVVAGTHPLTLQQLTRPVGMAFRPRPTGHVKLSRFAPFCPSSPHDYLHHTNTPNPPICTAFSTVLQLRRQPPPYFFHRPLPAQKHIIKWPYFLRHISGIPPASLTPNTPLRIIPPLMLNPIPQTTTQHKYLYIVNIHLITL